MTRYLIAAVLLLATPLCHAQALPEKPQPNYGTVREELVYPPDNHTEVVFLPVPRKTTDKKFIFLNSSCFAAAAVDSTLGITHLQWERNPLVVRQPPLMVGLGFGLCGFTTYMSHRWKREDAALGAAHIKGYGIKWWALPVTVTAIRTVGIVSDVVGIMQSH